MATEERPRRPRERRYVIVSKETVRHCAESVGVADLSDEILEALAEDVSYRVREVVQQSFELMCHAKRRKLTTGDFNNALQNADVQPLFGHGGKEPVTYQQTSNGELFCIDDSEVNVIAMATAEENMPQLASPTVNAQWLTIEGVPCSAASDEQSFATQDKAGVPRGTGIQSVSEDHLTYYEVVTKAILGSDASVMKCALNDVQTSSKISPLLAYFINFVSNGVKTVSHDTLQLRCLLYTVRALVTNRFLFLQPKPYLSLLCQTITYCLLEPLTASIHPSSDHWILRDYAAVLLAVTTRRWGTELNRLEHDNKKLLADVLSDVSRPLCSLYGAIVGLLAFGLRAVQEMLLPVLPGIVQRLRSTLSDSNAAARTDAHHVSSALLMCAEYLIRSSRSSLITDNTHSPPATSLDDVSERWSEITKPDFYAMLYEFHGDALAARLPAIYDCFSAAPTVQQLSETTSACIDSTAGQSGEQLLQQFLDPAPRKTDSDRGSIIVVRSERSSSVSSECADLGDLSVKETVSDPSRGIRLTILKKKPKLQADVDPVTSQPGDRDPKSSSMMASTAAAHSAQSKVKEQKKSPIKGISMQKVKLGLAEVFEDLVTFRRKQDIMFVFKFQGREQRCLPLLPRWGIGGRSTVSWYQVLCRRLPRVAPRTRRNPPSSTVRYVHSTRTAWLCSLDLAQTVI